MKNFRNLFFVFSTVLICFCLTGCCVSHEWQEATCTEPRTCSKCGKTEGKALGHKWQEATCTSPKTCSVCGQTSGNKLEHTPGEWVIDKAATCIEEGSQHSVCSVCGDNITKAIPKVDHKPGEWKISKAATVSSAGEKQQLCSVCGTILNTDTYELSAVEKENAYKNQCQSYSYDEIARNPDSYKGKYAVFTGKVIQSIEEGSSYTFRVNITKNRYGWEDTILVTYTKKDANESRILEDDVITMHGQLAGTYTYETVMGNNMTVPLFAAEYVNVN